MKNSRKMMLIVCLLASSAAAFADTNLYTRVERQVSAAQLANSARVEIEVKWSKPEGQGRLGRRCRPCFTRPRFVYKNTRCVGVFLNNGYVVTSSSCVRRHNGFSADRVILSFSNGKSVALKRWKVRTKRGIAQVKVDPSVTQGIIGMEVVSLQEGETLQDAYGKEVSDGLQQFLASRGVISSHDARLTARKPDLELGEPFFWKGKLVAVFNRVPQSLPVAFSGQKPEDFFSVFH